MLLDASCNKATRVGAPTLTAGRHSKSTATRSSCMDSLSCARALGRDDTFSTTTTVTSCPTRRWYTSPASPGAKRDALHPAKIEDQSRAETFTSVPHHRSEDDAGQSLQAGTQTNGLVNVQGVAASDNLPQDVLARLARRSSIARFFPLFALLRAEHTAGRSSTLWHGPSPLRSGVGACTRQPSEVAGLPGTCRPITNYNVVVGTSGGDLYCLGVWRDMPGRKALSIWRELDGVYN